MQVRRRIPRPAADATAGDVCAPAPPAATLRAALGALAIALFASACAGSLDLTPSDAPTVLSGHHLDHPNPALPGPHEVLTLYYGSGTDRNRPEYRDSVTIVTEPVDASKLVSLGGSAKSRNEYWGFPPDSFPVNARVWYPDDPGPHPLVLVVHGNHNMRDFSDPGYDWLGELLASRGYILASVDMNFINGGVRGENDGRGWLMLKHLQAWRRLRGRPGEPLPRAGRHGQDRAHRALARGRGGGAGGRLQPSDALPGRRVLRVRLRLRHRGGGPRRDRAGGRAVPAGRSARAGAGRQLSRLPRLARRRRDQLSRAAPVQPGGVRRRRRRRTGGPTSSSPPSTSTAPTTASGTQCGAPTTTGPAAAASSSWTACSRPRTSASSAASSSRPSWTSRSRATTATAPSSATTAWRATGCRGPCTSPASWTRPSARWPTSRRTST